MTLSMGFYIIFVTLKFSSSLLSITARVFPQYWYPMVLK